MSELTASIILKAIKRLPRGRIYDYPNDNTTTRFKVISVTGPEGPIKLLRWDSKKGETHAREVSISSSVLWRVASAITRNIPFQIDRVLGASFNSRSLLEALLANTTEFYLTKTQRIESRSNEFLIKKGHKHLVWIPEKPHTLGVYEWIENSFTISETILDNSWESMEIPKQMVEDGISLEVKRRHAQIQLALTQIGEHLRFRTYIAKNDQAIKCGDKQFADLDSVVLDLSEETILAPYSQACSAGQYIDAIWFRNSIHLPAVIEIEHSTGITSGLNRMLGFKSRIPALADTKYVITCADDERDNFFRKAAEPQFEDLDASYLPYSAVEELLYLARKGRLDGLSEDYKSAKKFFDGFLDHCN